MHKKKISVIPNFIDTKNNVNNTNKNILPKTFFFGFCRQNNTNWIKKKSRIKSRIK